MIKQLLLLSMISFTGLIVGYNNPDTDSNPNEMFKSYCLDFNWGEGGPNAFAGPGLWADAVPGEHIKWYKDLGVNVIQTFIVSCNGYAWYKNGVAPEQPGLKHDFLTEMVELGHQEGMKVMGYLCIGSNTRWGQEFPDYSYGFPADRHIPYTQKYLDYLDELIRDALTKTGVDGFMIDWFYQPNRDSNNGNWLESEKKRFEELMGVEFPGETKLSEEDYTLYSRKAIEACWEVIHRAAKETNPESILWLTAFDITHPHYVNSKMFRQVDWLMNEEGDIGKIDSIRAMVGKETQLITCLASWNKKDARKVVLEAVEAEVGLYGFTKPDANSLLPPVEHYLSSPIESFQGDDRNIATFARVFNKHSLDYLLDQE
jgi:hypothetical protein